MLSLGHELAVACMNSQAAVAAYTGSTELCAHHHLIVDSGDDLINPGPHQRSIGSQWLLEDRESLSSMV